LLTKSFPSLSLALAVAPRDTRRRKKQSSATAAAAALLAITIFFLQNSEKEQESTHEINSWDGERARGKSVHFFLFFGVGIECSEIKRTENQRLRERESSRK
jgi:hypothetical protein